MAKHTGRPVEQIERDTDRDRFMSAEEAKEYGLIDNVVTNRGEVIEQSSQPQSPYSQVESCLLKDFTSRYCSIDTMQCT